ncbi:MAG: hypothetical protein FWD53_01755 [Phycisphaerales bacterium]|nr:hypothetical protein [Phycisphaerales bacterium]
MSEPPPILEYVMSERRVPVYLVVVLYLWAVFDVLGGAFLGLGGVALLSMGAWSFGHFLLVLETGLVGWGILIFWLANQMRWKKVAAWRTKWMQQNQVAALRRSAILVIAAEIFAWVLAGTSLMALVYRVTEPDKVVTHPLFLVAIAVAVSVTRMMLRRAVKRVPTWGQSELQS